ncbi:MAG: endonuclease MutS2 [Chthonomonas sp.]|nr:endonuclease MutS2 [Chthonomonas sp.]
MTSPAEPITHALRVLEFERVLERLADHCQSSLGHALAKDLRPSFDEDAVKRRLALTDEAFRLLASEKLPQLGAIRDLRRPAEVAAKGGVLDGVTLFQIGEALSAMREFRGVLSAKRTEYVGLWRLAESWVEEPKTEEALARSIDSGGEVLDAASPELGRLRRAKRNAAQRLTDKVHSYTTGSHRDHLSDPIVTQRNGRFVVPVRSEHRSKIKGIVHDTSASGQTIFIEPSDVVEIANSLREAEAAEVAEVARVLAALSSRVGSFGAALVESLEVAGATDLILAKARYGYELRGCVPEASLPAHLLIELGRHPLLDPTYAVPLDIELGGPLDGVLITGPNTGGKTVALKSVGLFVAMAQSGMMLPARRARIGHFSGIWADIGDEQSMQQSLSTFSAHIKNIAEALTQLQAGDLVILDEIGAGTDPAEGAALAKAVLREIQRKKAKVIASTHYGELKLFATNAEGFINSSMEFDVKTLRPTYRLLTGTPGSSHALRIAERYGLPKNVVEEAKADQGVEEQDVARMLEQLEIAQKRAQKAQGESDRLTHRLKEVEAEAERKLQEADQIRRAARQKAADAVEEEMRRIRLDAAEAMEMIKRGKADEARELLKALNAQGAEIVAKNRPSQVSFEITKGMSVKLRGTSQSGTVLDTPRDGKVNVQLGALKMSLKTSELEPQHKPDPTKMKARKSHQLEKAQTARVELNIVGFRAEQAEHELERFLDDSVLAGMESVRIVHGKGEGILRSITRQVLKSHKGIKSFRDGQAEEGGQGATIAELR